MACVMKRVPGVVESRRASCDFVKEEGPIFDCRAEMKSVQGAADHRGPPACWCSLPPEFWVLRGTTICASARPLAQSRGRGNHTSRWS